MALIPKRSCVLLGLASVSWFGCGSGDESTSAVGVAVSGSSSFEGPSAGSVSVSVGGGESTGGAASGSSAAGPPIVAGAPDGVGCNECEAVECPSGSRPATSQGCLCPNYCAPDPSCLRATDLYDAVRSSVVMAPSSIACKTDGDCVSLLESNTCISCSYDAVSAAQADAILQVLTNEAQEDCRYCPAEPVNCAPAPEQPSCYGGACYFSAGLPR